MCEGREEKREQNKIFFKHEKSLSSNPVTPISLVGEEKGVLKESREDTKLKSPPLKQLPQGMGREMTWAKQEVNWTTESKF